MSAVTVAITTYNLKQYLKQCFDDLAAQTFRDFDILVYDDCSTDGTREQLAQFQEQLGNKLRLQLGETPLRMPAKARNALLNSEINGKYVVFLDGDDRIKPSFLEHLYTAAEAGQADVAVCAYDRFEDESGHVLCQEMRGWPEEIVLGEQIDRSPAFINTALWNKLIRTDLIDDLRMPECTVGEDASFLLALYLRSKKIVCIDEILIHYRVRAASVISNTPEETIYSFAGALQNLWNCASGCMRNHIALAAFIHIGLSMSMRAYDNPRIDRKKVMSWIRSWFAETFNWFRGNSCFRLSYLLRHGVKGLGLWGSLWFYRCNCFSLFLWAVNTAKKVFHVDFKF